MTDLRALVLSDVPEIRLRAVDLAYEIGKSEGHHDGKLKGLQEMYDANLASIHAVFAKTGAP